MFGIRLALAKLRALFRRDVTIDEIREELQFHVQMRTDELVSQRSGCSFGAKGGVAPLWQSLLDPGSRLRRARRRRAGDDSPGRQVRPPPTAPPTFLFDCRGLDAGAWHRRVHGALQRIDAALLRPLPYPNPEELVTLNVEETSPGRELFYYAPSMADIRRWRSLDRSSPTLAWDA